MSDHEHIDEHTNDPIHGADEPVHSFDQTNGVVEGLDGDADAPENANGDVGDERAAFIAAPAPGAQMAPGVFPVGAEAADDETEADPDSDDPTPA
ncbi:hypothetical protein [Curtobacterium ammoniigenes]|uniref:hypothetical protein n=1 Tax=Curtobacterium ammoniigenes TaxID=395387 RepID=UPI00082AAE2E|nr:hypothetical protein [Curtobacterium ammoniigenes]